MKYKSQISILLVIALIMGCMGWAPATAQQVQEENVAPSVAETSQKESLTEDSKILDYVDSEQFLQSDHIARLPQEETLDSYVFLNRDGSKSIYYMGHPVKYVDENGSIREKDTTLVRGNGGYSMRDNDVALHIPDAAATGITMSHNKRTVKLIPQGGSGSALQQDNSIAYVNYFGKGTILRYTPMLSGMKEDIILAQYTGQNSFTFLLETNGLNLYEDQGQYYLAESQNAEAVFHLGQIEVYDAIGRPDLGTMTVETVVPGQRYRLTVSADEDFLTDPKTVYPVTIDPTLTVRDTEEVRGTLEDTPVYSYYPNGIFGNYVFNPMGFVSDHGIGKTAVRLTSLLTDTNYSQLTADQLNSVTFYIKGSGGYYQNVSIHALTENSTWTEMTLTWNTLGAYTETAYATKNMGGAAWNAFNITNLAKDWKNGVQNPQCGFVMVSDSTTSNVSFFSGEYGTIDYRPYVVVNYTNVITLDQTSATVDKGDTLTLTATTIPAGQAVIWESDAPTVASVSDTGVVTALSPGTAIITATISDEITASCEIVVAKTINFNYNTSIKVYKGNEITLKADTEPAGEPVTWTSLNPDIATVENGVVTGVSPGNATIRAALSEKIYALCEVEVLATDVYFECVCGSDCAEDCTCGCPDISIYIEDTVTLTAITVPPGQSVTWESDDLTIATVSQTGMVTGISDGTTKIRAHIDQHTFAECTVTVSHWEVDIVEPPTRIATGDPVTLYANTTPLGKEITWSSSDPTIATVSQTGIVTGIKAGDVTITATLEDGSSATCAIIVQVSASLGTSFIELGQDEITQLRLEELPENAEITWTSTNTDIVMVDNGGRILGVRAGYAYVTADSKYLTEPTSIYIHVSLADGIYYIRNTTGFTISSDAFPQENGRLYSASKKFSGDSQLYQLWYIKKMGCCWYLISPVCDTNLYLDSISGELMLSTNMMSIWNISYEAGGYVIRSKNTGNSYEAYIQAGDPALGPGKIICAGGISSVSSRQYWHLENAEGMFLIDVETGMHTTDNMVITIEMGCTLDLDTLGLTTLEKGTQESGLSWSSSDTSVVVVDSFTGAVCGNMRGESIITVTQTTNSISYSRSYTLQVVETIYVVNVYDMTMQGESSYLRNHISNAIAFLNIVFSDFNLKFVMDSEPFQNENDPIADCPKHDSAECYSYYEECTNQCLSHHKNVHRISDQLYEDYFEKNHVIVNWSNCNEGIYCGAREIFDKNGVFLTYKHTPQSPLALVVIDEEHPKGPNGVPPVAQIITITKRSFLESKNYSAEAYMAIVLAHEIAHTLGLREVYQNAYGDNLDHEGEEGMQCIMENTLSSYDRPRAITELYERVTNLESSALCDYCKEKLKEYMPDDVYEEVDE